MTRTLRLDPLLWLAVLIFVSVSLVSSPVGAQINPFEEAEEEEPEQKEKKEKEEQEEKEKSEEQKKERAEEGDGEKAERETAEKAEKADDEGAAASGDDDAAEAEEPSPTETADDEGEAKAREKARPPEERVALVENFGRAELITTGVVLPAGLGLAIGGPSLLGEPDPSMTSPRLGSIDYKLSVASHGDLREGSPFLFGIFDVAAVAYPAALGGFYLLSGLYYWAADEPMLASQSVNIDHAMIGMAETVGWTALTAGIVHAFIGRQRPYAAFDRSAYGSPEDSGANLSFFSTTAAIGFAMSGYAARDYADWAMRNGGNPVTGVILPYTVLYGLSTVIGYSAIYNQEHYFSDIAIGGLTGVLIGNLAYVAHFDTDGNPRRRWTSGEQAVAPTLLRRADGASVWGLGFTRRW